MSKSKKDKKRIAEINKNIDKIKNSVKRLSARSNFVRAVSFEKQTSKNLFRFDAVLDCGSFNLNIVYYHDTMPLEHSIDAELHFDNSDYIYTFYDIFNLFGINDFNLYYYEDLKSAQEFNDAVKNIIDTSDKYLKYIVKAQTAEYLPLLEKNYETDMTAVTGDDSWKNEETDLFFLPPNHLIYSYANDEITTKIHKKLKKENDKGRLELIYEKRLLKYLDEGNTVERKELEEKISFEKLYSRRSKQIIFIVFIAVFVVVLALFYIANKIIFDGAEFFIVNSFISNRSDGLIVNFLVNSAFCSLFISTAVWYIFGLNLIVKYMPDNMKTRAENKYRKEAGVSRRNIKHPELYRLMVGLVSIILSILFFFLVSFDNIGYYDNYVKFSDQNTFIKMVDVSYEELNIYRVQYDYIGRHNTYQPVENAYILADNSGNYYNCGEINPNGKTQAKLNEIAEKYNKEIIEVESIDYIPNI